MILTTVISRLREMRGSAFASIDGAEELDALSKGTAPRHGTAFVVPYAERALENELATGGFRQHVEVDFLVAVVIRRHDDPRGTSRLQASDEFSAAIEDALKGWSWHESCAPAELVSARAAPAGQGVTLYVQTWRTNRWIEG